MDRAEDAMTVPVDAVNYDNGNALYTAMKTALLKNM